jgi:hypothetical protein
LPQSTPDAYQEREKEGTMADCELLKGCLFFNDKMAPEKGVGAIFKQSYCLGDSGECARYRVAKALGREKVPQNLYPNMHERAAALIADEA